MNILEAIHSGLPFKREHWDIYYISSQTYKAFDMVDIMATDWITLAESPEQQLDFLPEKHETRLSHL